MRTVLACIALVLLLSSSSAFALDPFAVGTTAPTDNVASFSQPATATPGWMQWKSRSATDFENPGSTFLTGSSSVIADKLTICVYNNGAGGNDITAVPVRFVMYKATAQNDGGGTLAPTSLSGAPDLTTIVADITGTMTVPIDANSPKYLTFDFTNVQLDANQWYGFYTSMTTYSKNPNNYLYWQKEGNSSTYPGMELHDWDTNRRYLADDALAYPQGDDMVFWIQTAAAPALKGDADRNGKVDFQDYLALESSFGNSVTPGTGADFDNNGIVDFQDYLALESNFGAGAVPEPMTLSLLGLGGLALIRRKK